MVTTKLQFPALLHKVSEHAADCDAPSAFVCVLHSTRSLLGGIDRIVDVDGVSQIDSV